MVCDLWLVDFDPFCVCSLPVIAIMIDGSEKRNCEGGFWTLELPSYVYEKRSNNVHKLTRTH